MDIKRIRLSNINFLADKHGRERIAECDERKKWTTNYVNQLCGGFGSFGAATARRIEKGLGLAHGWIDVPHIEVDYGIQKVAPSDTTEILTLWERMSPEERAKLLKIGAALVDE